MAYKVFANGYNLNASELNTYLMNQSVMVFADATARTAALTSPTEGMVTYLADTNAMQYYDGAAWTAVGQDSALTNVLITAPRELTNVQATATTGTTNFNVAAGSHMYHTANAAGNFTVNIRSTASIALNTIMAVGETVTAVFSCTNGTTAYYMTGLTIDGNSQTVKWAGGTAPTSGNASSIDVYTFAITKTASATFVVYGTVTKFA